MKNINRIQSHPFKLAEHRRVAPGNNRLVLAALALTCVACALPTSSGADAQRPLRGPDLPTLDCEKIEAPVGSFLSAHLYASGVQIYRWNGTAWVFVAPEAVLSADPGYESEVGF